MDVSDNSCLHKIQVLCITLKILWVFNAIAEYPTNVVNDKMRMMAWKDDIHTRIHTLTPSMEFSWHGENVGKSAFHGAHLDTMCLSVRYVRDLGGENSVVSLNDKMMLDSLNL